MNKLVVSKLLLSFIFSMFMVNGYAVEIAKWDKKPVPVRLSIGDERIVFFPDNISVGAPAGVMSKLRIQSNGGAVFLLASDEIPETRLQVKLHSTGKVVLLDVWAQPSEDPVTEDVRVVLSDTTNKDVHAANQSQMPQRLNISPVILTRYVSQRYYAPRRLWVDTPGINQINLKIEGEVNPLIKGRNFGLIEVLPDAAWTGGGYYITALRLVNTSMKDLVLDYTDINAQFAYATFQHHTLKRHGLPGDTTMLYLITTHPLEHSLYPWMPAMSARGK